MWTLPAPPPPGPLTASVLNDPKIMALGNGRTIQERALLRVINGHGAEIAALHAAHREELDALQGKIAELRQVAHMNKVAADMADDKYKTLVQFLQEDPVGKTVDLRPVIYPSS